MKLKWFGTAAISIETANGRILVDPFIPLCGSTVDTSVSDYSGYDNIIITHAHFDHIGSIPEIICHGERSIYGTQAVHDALRKLGIPEAYIHIIAPGSKLTFGGIGVTAYKGRHISYDGKTVVSTLFNRRVREYSYNCVQIDQFNRICQEKKETISYLVEADGKRVFILGSLGLDSDTTYPQGVDSLVLPYQGASDLLTPALAAVERLQPKAVLLDHYDDTFPPVSNAISTADIEKALRGRIECRKLEYHNEIVV